MKHSKSVVLVVTILITLSFFFLIGCDQTQQVKPQQVKSLASTAQSLSDQLVSASDQMTANLASSGLLKPQELQAIEGLNVQIKKAASDFTSVASSIQNGNYSEGDDGLLTLLKTIQAANLGTASFNKFWPIINAAMVGLIAILTVILKKKAADVKEANYQADAAYKKEVLATKTLGAVTMAIKDSPDSAKEPIKTAVAKNLSAAGITVPGSVLITEVKTA